MKKTNLTIEVDTEKLAALRQYAAKKNVNISAELSSAVERLYEKYVPSAVREYLAERDAVAPSSPPRPHPSSPGNNQ